MYFETISSVCGSNFGIWARTSNQRRTADSIMTNTYSIADWTGIFFWMHTMETRLQYSWNENVNWSNSLLLKFTFQLTPFACSLLKLKMSFEYRRIKHQLRSSCAKIWLRSRGGCVCVFLRLPNTRYQSKFPQEFEWVDAELPCWENLRDGRFQALFGNA